MSNEKMTTEQVIKALRCGDQISGRCYKECEFRENYYCELSERRVRHAAAALIELQDAEIARLTADRDEALRTANINAQLFDEAQRRERAAIEDLKENGFCKSCSGCNAPHNPNNTTWCYSWQWRGPREAGKESAE